MKPLYLVFLICVMFSAKGAKPLNDFKAILQKYQKNRGVKMAFKKQAYFPLLKKRKNSQGEIFLSGKKILFKLKDHFQTQVLFDGKKWWHIITPPGENKRVSLIPAGQNISLLFQSHTFFKNFRLVSQKMKGRTHILHFEPFSQQSPIKSLGVQTSAHRILKVWVQWKVPANEEVFDFFHIRFNQQLPDELFLKVKTVKN